LLHPKENGMCQDLGECGNTDLTSEYWNRLQATTSVEEEKNRFQVISINTGKRKHSMHQLRYYLAQYLYCRKQIHVCITTMNPAVSYIADFVHRVSVSSNCKACNLNHTELNAP